MWSKVLIALAVIVIAFGFYRMLNAREVSAGPETVAFTGIDLSCKPCTGKIENTLSNIIGIQSSHLYPAKDTVRITFNSGMMRASWIAHSLKAAGLKPENMKIVQK